MRIVYQSGHRVAIIMNQIHFIRRPKCVVSTLKLLLCSSLVVLAHTVQAKKDQLQFPYFPCISILPRHTHYFSRILVIWRILMHTNFHFHLSLLLLMLLFIQLDFFWTLLVPFKDVPRTVIQNCCSSHWHTLFAPWSSLSLGKKSRNNSPS